MNLRMTVTVGASVATSSSHNFEWIISIFFMILCPSILIFLHNLCTAHGTNLKPPSISLNPLDYFDKEAMMIVLSFLAVLRFCEFVCIGKYVEGHRINGEILSKLLNNPKLIVYFQVFKLYWFAYSLFLVCYYMKSLSTLFWRNIFISWPPASSSPSFSL